MLADGASVWFTPLYLYNDVSGMKAGNFSNSYQSSLGGMTLGGDYTVTGKDNAKWRSGAAVSVGTGDVKSGAISTRRKTMSISGESGVFGLDERQSVRDRFIGIQSQQERYHSGVAVFPCKWAVFPLIHMRAHGMWGVKGEYRFETPNVDVIPYAGVHYTHLKTNGFDVIECRPDGFQHGKRYPEYMELPAGRGCLRKISNHKGWMVKTESIRRYYCRSR